MAQNQNQPNQQQNITPEQITLYEQSKKQDQQQFMIPQRIQDEEYTCYQNVILCCGNCCGGLRTYFPFPCCCFPYPYKEVRQFQLGLKQRFGRFQEQLVAGLHSFNPCGEEIILINKRTQMIALPVQPILTKDNLCASIDAVVYFRIVDSYKVQYTIKDLYQSVRDITYVALRTISGEHTLQELLEKRQKVSDELEKFVYKHVQQWGIIIEAVFIKDMQYSQDLQDSLSMATKTKKLGESKVISAKADVEAAKLLRKAADMLNTDAAMQIRYFDTINQFQYFQNQKIMFLPLQPDNYQDDHFQIDNNPKQQDKLL